MRREAIVNPFSAYCLLPAASCLLFLSACEPEVLRRQAEMIRQQQEEIARQRRGIEELMLARQREEEKRRNCLKAFADFEKAQLMTDAREAVALYRRGLGLCPDDDVARYELGKILLAMGRAEEARAEFQEALRINPNFMEAKRQLEGLR